MLHRYTPSAPNAGDFPDHPADLFFAPAAGAYSARLLVPGASTDAGDGLYQVDTSFAMTLYLASNNNPCIAFDPSGTFDALGTPQTYYGAYAGAGRLMRESDNQTIVAGTAPAVLDVEVLSATDLALVLDESGTSNRAAGIAHVSTIPVAYTLTIIAGPSAESASLVTGAFQRMGPKIHSIFSPGRLMEIDTAGSTVELATTLSPGWTWVAAVVPPDTHSAGAKPVYLVLESNRALAIDRVIELAPP
jgi:hypothetical protein